MKLLVLSWQNVAHDISYGVPQGGFLGLLLFLLTTLSDSITFIQNRYADDKQLYVSVETDDTVFNLN